eukprot:TRINITY_DN47274_c0_g1_i1.p1 TRINITY_DN47274_c0_g1~~TRINITY_DN47274_c0_g1_i1.p1  ORF type:complete len:458 (+),score=18.39 TRINITY_DN47274_c0_g1_i1:40-1413(+)
MDLGDFFDDLRDEVVFAIFQCLPVPGWRWEFAYLCFVAVCVLGFIKKLVHIFQELTTRKKFNALRNPEDTNKVSPGGTDDTPNEVTRVVRIHANACENFPVFMAVGYASLQLTKRDDDVVHIVIAVLIILYFVLRLVHFICFIKGIQPFRTMSYAFGQTMVVLVGLIQLRWLGKANCASPCTWLHILIAYFALRYFAATFVAVGARRKLKVASAPEDEKVNSGAVVPKEQPIELTHANLIHTWSSEFMPLLLFTLLRIVSIQLNSADRGTVTAILVLIAIALNLAFTIAGAIPTRGAWLVSCFFLGLQQAYTIVLLGWHTIWLFGEVGDLDIFDDKTAYSVCWLILTLVHTVIYWLSMRDLGESFSRFSNMHANIFEQYPNALCLLGMRYCLAEGNKGGIRVINIILVSLYTLTRLVHCLMHGLGLQPWRTVFFVISMATLTVAAAMMVVDALVVML